MRHVQKSIRGMAKGMRRFRGTDAGHAANGATGAETAAAEWPKKVEAKKLDATRVCELREVAPAASYRVTIYRAYEPEAPLVMKGADLQKFKVVIDDRPGSVIVEYSCL